MHGRGRRSIRSRPTTTVSTPRNQRTDRDRRASPRLLAHRSMSFSRHLPQRAAMCRLATVISKSFHFKATRRFHSSMSPSWKPDAFRLSPVFARLQAKAAPNGIRISRAPSARRQFHAARMSAQSSPSQAKHSLKAPGPSGSKPMAHGADMFRSANTSRPHRMATAPTFPSHRPDSPLV